MYVESDIKVFYSFAGDNPSTEIMRIVDLKVMYDNGNIRVKGHMDAKKPSAISQTAYFDSIREKEQIHDFCNIFTKLTCGDKNQTFRMLVYADPFINHKFGIRIVEMIPDNLEIVPLIQSWITLKKLLEET